VSRPQAPNAPRPIRVRTRQDGTPLEVAGERVEAEVESWLVEDCWWTTQPVRRRYWETVTVRGRDIVVFRDLHSGGWFTQAA